SLLKRPTTFRVQSRLPAFIIGQTSSHNPSPNGGPISATPSFYPPSPGLVPEELTRVTGAFRLRAMFLVGFVIFFFLLYLGLIVLSWYLFWLGIVLPVRRPDIAAGYGETFLFPGKNKNLYLGLGLVNAVNLTEFKAVLAHEFAHISQKSMAVNNYAYLAITVAENMFYGRDFLDDWLERGRRADN